MAGPGRRELRRSLIVVDMRKAWTDPQGTVRFLRSTHSNGKANAHLSGKSTIDIAQRREHFRLGMSRPFGWFKGSGLVSIVGAQMSIRGCNLPSCHRAVTIAVAAAITVVIGGCICHRDPGRGNSPAISGVVSEQGVNLVLANVARAAFPPGLVPAMTTVTLRRIEDVGITNLFYSASASFGIRDSEDFAVGIDIAAAAVATGDISAEIAVSESLAAKASEGRPIVVAVQEIDHSDDPDKGESIDTLYLLDGTYDPRTRVILTKIPGLLFGPYVAQEGHVAVLLRVAALPDYDAAEPPPPSASHGIVISGITSAKSSSASDCPGDASFAAPILYGWRQAAADNVTQFYDSSVAGIVGPFAEPRQCRNRDRSPHTLASGQPDMSCGHGGMDFFADDGTPVYAVSNGFIESIGDQNWSCWDGKRIVRPYRSGAVANPEYRLTLAVTDDSGRITERVTYRHLNYDSATFARNDDFKTCWMDNGSRTYKVRSNDLIAVTGRTGAIGPHLHLEWVPTRRKQTAAVGLSNPLCKLTSLFHPGMTAPVLATGIKGLFGQYAPGTSAWGDSDSSGVDFLVRRNKPPLITQVCFSKDPKRPCDRGGKGFFHRALVSAVGKSLWPVDSDGEMGKVDFEASPPRLIMRDYPQAPTPHDPNIVTQAPNTTFSLFPIFDVQLQYPCGFIADYVLGVSVFSDMRRLVRASFATREKGTLTSAPMEFGDDCELHVTASH